MGFGAGAQTADWAKEGLEMSLEDIGREELGLGLRLVLGGARAKARVCRSWG